MKKVLIKAILSKAGKKNISKLVPRIITDKNGYRMKVWVRPDEAKKIPIEHPKRKEESTQTSERYSVLQFHSAVGKYDIFINYFPNRVGDYKYDVSILNTKTNERKLLNTLTNIKDARITTSSAMRELEEEQSEKIQKPEESSVSTPKTEEVKTEDSGKKAPSWVKPEDIGLWDKVVERLKDKFNYGSATKVFKIYKEREGDTSYGTVETKSKKEIDPKSYLPGGDQYFNDKEYGNNAASPIITFKTRDQAVIFAFEMLGQISDGYWENSSPHNHYQRFDGVEVKTGEDVGTQQLHLSRHYNFNNKELKDIVGDRMKDQVKTARFLGDKLNAKDLDLVSSYLMESWESVKRNQNDKYWKEKLDDLYHILSVNSIEALEKIREDIKAVDYSDKDLSRDLKEIGYVVNGKANEDKRKSKEELDKI